MLFGRPDQNMSADENLEGAYPPIYPFSPG